MAANSLHSVGTVIILITILLSVQSDRIADCRTMYIMPVMAVYTAFVQIAKQTDGQVGLGYTPSALVSK